MHFPVIVLAAGLAMSSLATGVSAQQISVDPSTCPETPDIRRLAQTVLDGRADLRVGFQPPGFLTDAAYLLVRYSDLDAGGDLAVFDDLLSYYARPPRDAGDAARALAVARLGVEDGLARGSDDPLHAFFGAGYATQRAILLADAGESYFTLLGRVADRNDLEGGAFRVTSNGVTPASLTLDLSGEERRALAVSALRAGFAVEAAYIFAALGDTAAIDTLLTLFPDDATLEFLFSGPALNGIALSAWASDRPLRPVDGPTPVNLQLARAALIGPRHNWLIPFFNQLGPDAPASASALPAILAAIQASSSPAHDIGAVWIAQYAVLHAAGIDPDRALTGFDTGQAIDFTSSFNPLGQIGSLMARQAGARWLAGGQTTLPAAPPLWPLGLDWAPFADALLALSEGRAAQIEADAYRAFAAFVLFDTGHLAEAEALALTLDDHLSVLAHFLEALDSHCLAAQFLPGMALTTFGNAVYDFPLR